MGGKVDVNSMYKVFKSVEMFYVLCCCVGREDDVHGNVQCP